MSQSKDKTFSSIVRLTDCLKYNAEIIAGNACHFGGDTFNELFEEVRVANDILVKILDETWESPGLPVMEKYKPAIMDEEKFDY